MFDKWVVLFSIEDLDIETGSLTIADVRFSRLTDAKMAQWKCFKKLEERGLKKFCDEFRDHICAEVEVDAVDKDAAYEKASSKIRSVLDALRIFKGKCELREPRGAVMKNKHTGKEEFFEGYSMPEYISPRNLSEGSKEQALYLTYVISVDYMTDAEKLWRNSRGAYELYPERFEPETILKLGDRTLEAFLRRIGARFSSTGVDTWRRISKILLEKYEGDPRNITRESLTIKDIKKKLDEFPYLRGSKLSNFYIRAMGEKGLFKIKNFDELDIPVDKQVARLTIYTGVLKLLSDRFEGCVHEDPLRSLIQEAWRNAAKAHNTYPWKLDEPVWTIGSKLCTQRRCSPCPVREHCDKTKGVRFTNGIIVWERMQ